MGDGPEVWQITEKACNMSLSGGIYWGFYFCFILVPWPAWTPASIQHTESGLLCLLMGTLIYPKYWICSLESSVCPLSGVSLCHMAPLMTSELSYIMSVLRRKFIPSSPWKWTGCCGPVCNSYFLPFMSRCRNNE